MMIEKVRYMIESNINKCINFKFNGSRNQVEEFSGTIIGTYKSVFIIKTDDDLTKSFSYADVLIGNLELILH